MSELDYLRQQVMRHRLSRRDFLGRASALGLSVAAATTLYGKTLQAATPKQGGTLRIEVLAASRNTGIADEHAAGVGIWLAAHGSPCRISLSQVFYHLRQRYATRKPLIFRGRPICRGF